MRRERPKKCQKNKKKKKKKKAGWLETPPAMMVLPRRLLGIDPETQRRGRGRRLGIQ